MRDFGHLCALRGFERECLARRIQRGGIGHAGVEPEAVEIIAEIIVRADIPAAAIRRIRVAIMAAALEPGGERHPRDNPPE